MKWNKQTYAELIEYLYSNADETYRDFTRKLLNDNKTTVIGIRIPKLRKIARYIVKNDYKGFIKYNSHTTHEEKLLHGLILGYLKIDKEEVLKLIDEFMPHNNNWAINDTTTNNLKIFKNISLDYLDKYLKSNNPWETRFGLTLLISHYINEDNIDKILKICDNVKHDDYYVKMANAWLLSICYIKFSQKTLKYLMNNNLDKFTFNKTISKICDSYQVSKEDKNYLKSLRR